MWKSIFIFVLFLTLPQRILAAEDLNIKGIKIGTTYGELKSAFPADLDCFAANNMGKDARICYRKAGSDSYAGDTARISYTLRADTVVAIDVAKLSPEKYDAVMVGLSEKFGKPTDIGHGQVESRMGVKYENFNAQWHRGDLLLSIEKFDGSINEMGIHLVSITAAKRQAVEMSQKAKSDL